jgi:hypothetical protein
LLGGEGEARLGGRAAAGHLRGDVFAQRRAVLEAVAGAAAHQPYVFHLRVAVNQEIAVGGIFVLAYTGLDDGRFPQRRKAARHIAAHPFRRFLRHDAGLGIGVDALAVPVECDLETAILQIREAVDFVPEKEPGGHGRGSELQVARRHAEEENLLPAGENLFAEQSRKHFSQPRAAGKNELPG